MSSDITVNVSRASVQVYAGVQVQIDTMSQQEASYYQGTSPYFRYQGYVLSGTIQLQQGDLMVDVVNIDSKTGTYKHYRIISDPESFPDSHVEFVLDRVVGT